MREQAVPHSSAPPPPAPQMAGPFSQLAGQPAHSSAGQTRKDGLPSIHAGETAAAAEQEGGLPGADGGALVPGAAVWVYGGAEECYRRAEVLAEDNKGTVRVRLAGEGGERAMEAAEVHLAEPSGRKEGVDDNTMLTHLNEPNLLENLRARFGKDLIYTYTGSILLAVNPYKAVGLYGDDVIAQYRGRPRGANPPHVYAMADRVHRALNAERLNQSIIVSGESGAGKTETCKAVMSFLLAVRGGDEAQRDGASLDARILQTSPILEAFGNAKTLRNNNSSRFGKFTKILFSEGMICGAMFEHYLLEKARLVDQGVHERNFHIFYFQKRIVSAETIRGNTVLHLYKINSTCLKLIECA